MSEAIALTANATKLTTDMTDSSVVAEGFALVGQRYATRLSAPPERSALWPRMRDRLLAAPTFA